MEEKQENILLKLSSNALTQMRFFQPSIDSAIKVLKIIEAALESSKNGKTVRVNPT